MDNQPIVIERTYNAPVAKIWAALTDGAQMKQWYFDIPGFKPQVGYEFEFHAGEPGKEYLHKCTVTQAIENKIIAYTWRYEGYPGNSEVSFELFPHGATTVAKLTHKGLETFGTTNPDLAKKNFVTGWTEFMDTALKDFVEQD